MPSRNPLLSGEIKKYRARQKDTIRKSNKIRESTVEDKAHHAAFEHFHIQIMSVQAEDPSRAYHAKFEQVRIQIMIIQAEDLSRVHHSALYCVHIQH